MTRQNMTFIFVGMQGTGKTVSTKKVIQTIFQKNPSINKLVVFDEPGSDIWNNLETYDHPEWAKDVIVTIPVEDLHRLKSGKVKIEQTESNIKGYLSAFKKIKNSIIIFEDATRYLPISKDVPEELMSILLNAKQRNVEVILVFHSLMDIPVLLARNIRVIVMFKTLDRIFPSKLKDPRIENAWHDIKNSKNPFISKTIPINVNMITSNKK